MANFIGNLLAAIIVGKSINLNVKAIILVGRVKRNVLDEHNIRTNILLGKIV